MSEEKQARPDYELIAELVDPNTPKNEREHAAARQMTLLWEQLAEQVSELARLREGLSKDQESEFHPDWSMLEATREALREHMAIGAALRQERDATSDRFQSLISEYSKYIESSHAEIERLRGEIDEWKNVALVAARTIERLNAALKEKKG